MNDETDITIPPLESKNIYPAIIAAQAELTNPTKNVQGYGYKYAGLDQVVTLLRDVLPRHGLWFEQNLQPAKEGHVGIETFIIHVSGERTASSIYEHPLDDARGMNSSQSSGSCISYAKRYALGTVFALPAEEDTDGVVKAEEDTVEEDTNEAGKKSKAKDKKIKTNKPQLTANVSAEKKKNKITPEREERLKAHDRLKALGALDYADSRNINPDTCELATVRKILALTDEEILKRVKDFEKEQEKEAA